MCRLALMTLGLILMPDVGSAQTVGFGLGAGPLGNLAGPAGPPPSVLDSWQGSARRGPAFDPDATGSVRDTAARAAEPLAALDVVRRCRRAIVAAAIPYRVARVDAIGAGPLAPVRDGYVAPIDFSIVYRGGGARETRDARISCFLDRGGRVTAVR